MQEFENSPIKQNSREYLQEQKELHDYPLYRSGLELSADLANITAKAMLITQEHLIYNPDIFDKYRFKNEREFILKQPEQEQELLLGDLSLNLTKKHKMKLKDSINFFLADYENDVIKKIPQESEDENFENLKSTLWGLLGSEIDIQKAFNVYVDLAYLLNKKGMDITVFKKILQLMKMEGIKKYASH
jgi:hypothetical protein